MSPYNLNPPLNCSDRWERSGEGRLCFRLQDDRIAQTFQLSNEPLLNLLFIDGGQVVNSFLVVGLTALDHVIENHQDTVTDSHRCFLAPASRTDAAILFAKIGLGMPRRMSRLNEYRFG